MNANPKQINYNWKFQSRKDLDYENLVAKFS